MPGMNSLKIAGAITAALLLTSVAACGGSDNDGNGNKPADGFGIGAGGTKDADAKACRDFDALPDDAGDAETAKVIAVAKGGTLIKALKEMQAYPDNMGLDAIAKVAITYEKIRSACSDADVDLPSFEELLNSGEDDEGNALPACPEKAGDEFTYDEVVTMNEDGCKQSDGSQSLVVYGGECSDGRRFAYKNLSDIEGREDDGEDDYAYVVVPKGGTAKVIASPDGTSDALGKLQMDCND